MRVETRQIPEVQGFALFLVIGRETIEMNHMCAVYINTPTKKFPIINPWPLGLSMGWQEVQPWSC